MPPVSMQEMLAQAVQYAEERGIEGWGRRSMPA
jgi:hypothetical protein